MAKKTAPKQKLTSTIPPLFLALVFVQCIITLFVVLHLQTEINHAALLQKIDTMKSTNQNVYCPNPEIEAEKSPIDNAE
jgi:hypothetical protein